MNPISLSRTQGSSKKGTLVLILFALFCVIVPVLFFWGTWYGKRLDDAQLREYLSEQATPNQVRHGLTELSLRMESGALGLEPWIDVMLEVSRRDDPAVRFAAAWAMQHDASRPKFVARLTEMLTDDSLVVRQNAATSLSLAGSMAGRAVLHAMLASHTVTSPEAGTLRAVAGHGEQVEAGRFVARVGLDDGSAAEIRAPVSGIVRRVLTEVGAAVAPGTELVVLGPDPEAAFNAVTALGRAGEAEDRAALQQAIDPRNGFPERVQRQASAALRAINARSAE